MKICFTGNAPIDVEVEPGSSIAAAARAASIEQKYPCRGYGRCGTCIVNIESGAENLSQPNESESRVLRILKANSGQRLACQALANDDVVCRF
ncbi:MAG: (2Fe-2S)-binding protein [Holophagales bacterium]|nr:(2Fe-2S)-binding protein [Holophagales bacterium]